MILYAVTIFLSAFLLFQVQPLIAKMILPWFGGTAAVWTICMLFFQLLLLAGYVYSHAYVPAAHPGAALCPHRPARRSRRRRCRSPRAAPGSPRAARTRRGVILGLLATSVGLPYFVLSTTGPLVQAWHARSHPGRSALPAVRALQPGLDAGAAQLPAPRRATAGAQDAGGDLVRGLCSCSRCCAPCSPGAAAAATTHRVRRRGTRTSPDPVCRRSGSRSRRAPRRCSSPSPSHMTLNIAAIPFLWVLPLALYLPLLRALLRGFGLVPALAVSCRCSARASPRICVTLSAIQPEHLDPDPALFGDAVRRVHGVPRRAGARRSRIRATSPVST